MIMKSLLRLLIVSFLITSFASCDYFSFQRKKDFEKIDTNVDTTLVDTPPSFDVCNSFIDKKEKTDCFRKTIHQEISKSLLSENIQVKKTIDETVNVVITIHSNKNITLKKIEASKKLYEQIPEFKEMIQKAIRNLPKVYPAIKRSIPVTSEYRLPISIAIKE